MGILGSIRRGVIRTLRDKWDSLEISRMRRSEIIKFKDPRRVAIFSEITLTPEQQHQIDDFYTANYGEKIPHTWHRHFTAFTGNFDYRYFPELLYIPEFEYFMNSRRAYISAFTDKNVLPLIAKSAGIITPRVILSCTCGIFRDEDYRVITREQAAGLLNDAGEVFIKPTVETGSGLGCEVVNAESYDAAMKIIERLGADFVVQERLKCHEDIARIYSGSVNTFRIITYIWHGQVKHAPVIMRIGQGGKYLDNAHAGGMFVAVDYDGTLHERAFTEFRQKFTQHPDTGITFNGYKIVGFPDVLRAAERMHEVIPQIGVVNWDFTINEDGRPLLMEGNMRSGSIWLAQMAHGKAIFGDDTAEILQWTQKMKRLKRSQRTKIYPLS